MFNNNEDLRLTNSASKKQRQKRVVTSENDFGIGISSSPKNVLGHQLKSRMENVISEFQSPRPAPGILTEQSPNTPSSEKRPRQEATAPSPRAEIPAVSPAVQEILNFCQRANAFQLRYEDRYRYLYDGNTWEDGATCASEKLITELTSLLFSVNPNGLLETLNENPGIKDSFQQSLMSLLKQIAMMEVQRTADNTILNLAPEQIKSLEEQVSQNYDNLENFKSYMEKQVGQVGDNLVKNMTSVPFVSCFRTLFPGAEPAIKLPGELGQDRIKPFIDQVQKIFKLAFRPQPAPEQNQRHLANRRVGVRNLNF